MRSSNGSPPAAAGACSRRSRRRTSAGVLVCGALAALAACAPRQEPGRIANLDAKNGFRGARFHAAFSEFDGLAFSRFKDGLGCYRRSGDDLKVGEARVEYIEYCFYDGRLAGVIQWGVGADTATELLKALRTAYGKGERLTGHNADGRSYPIGEMWRGKKVTATLVSVESEVNPMMDIPEVVVLLSSNDLLAERDRAAAAKANTSRP
jgi:hypothetical protein